MIKLKHKTNIEITNFILPSLAQLKNLLTLKLHLPFVRPVQEHAYM